MTLTTTSPTTTQNATVRVFLVDDHEMVHEGLAALLERSTSVTMVGGTTSAVDAVERLAEAAPQVALVDISLQDGSGVSVARRIREAHPEVRCLVFTWHGEREALLATVLAGAAGYVIKQLDADTIEAAVRRSSQGVPQLDPVAVRALADRCRASARSGDALGRLSRGGLRLSTRELDILDDAIAGLTDSEIAARQQLSAEAANRYVSLLFTKLSLVGRRA